MSIIRTYQEGKFSQIDLDDGTKVLLSFGTTDIKLFKVGFWGLSGGTIHTFSSKFTYELMQKIDYDLSKDVVKILAGELVKAKTLEEARQICIKLETNKKFLDGV